MITKEYGKFVVSCEICADVLCTVDTFGDALEEIKAAGWKTEKVSGKFEHYCTSCD